MDDDWKVLSLNLKRLRLEAGFSQGKLAEATGVSTMQLSRYERGVTIPTLQTSDTICTALGVTLDTLLGYEERKRKC